jgi:UDP-3-O-[3-hydroxymyristoyl] glucosamine N-acyltransferase
MICF